MPTADEPPVVAQSARPRRSTASARLAAIRSAAADAAASGSATTTISGSSPTSGLHPVADQRGGGPEGVNGDGIAPASLDRLGQQVDVVPSWCAEVAIPG